MLEMVEVSLQSGSIRGFLGQTLKQIQSAASHSHETLSDGFTIEVDSEDGCMVRRATKAVYAFTAVHHLTLWPCGVNHGH